MKKKEMFLLVCLVGGVTAGHWQRLLLSATYGVQV